MIRAVHSAASRVLVGLGVLVAALVAIGYAFIFSGIATPPATDLGTVAIPETDGVVPVYLSDGRPAFVIRSGEAVAVLDARPPYTSGAPGRLVVWCGDAFDDIIEPSIFAANGDLLLGTASRGLTAYPTITSADGREILVGANGAPTGVRVGEGPPHSCDVSEATMHEPAAGEVFDPSVAADREPPGWVWLEGRLAAAGEGVMLCDPGGDCASGAVVRGIDPAKVDLVDPSRDGRFIGRIRDGAIDELHYVPLSEAGR